MRYDDPTADISALEQGDEGAQRRLFEEHAAQLKRLAARYLAPGTQRTEGASDVVSEAMHSFFRRAEAGQFELGNGEDVLRVLAGIVAHKASHKNRAHFADKRGGGKVRGGSFTSGGESRDGLDQIALFP